MMNRTIIPEMLTAEGFTAVIIDQNEEHLKGIKVKQLAKKLAHKYEKYKNKAIKLLEDAEALDKFLEMIEDKMEMLGPKGKKFAYIPEMAMLVRSYIIKEYTDISGINIFLMIIALLHFLSPIDIIPDFIPGAGLLDDVIVMKTIIKKCDQDIEDYMEWRKNKQ